MIAPQISHEPLPPSLDVGRSMLVACRAVVRRRRIGCSNNIPLCDFAPPRLCVKDPASSHDQASIKAKTPAIVHNQGMSRQTMKKLNATITSANGAAPYQPRATLWVRTPNDPSPEGAAPPIKANQGKRQIRESSCWMGRTGVRMPNRVPRKNPLLGERKQVRESVPLTCLTASPCLYGPGRPDPRNPKTVPDFPQSRQKTQQSSLIKANQGKR